MKIDKNSLMSFTPIPIYGKLTADTRFGNPCENRFWNTAREHNLVLNTENSELPVHFGALLSGDHSLEHQGVWGRPRSLLDDCTHGTLYQDMSSLEDFARLLEMPQKLEIWMEAECTWIKTVH
jgi:hypothetical protein